MRNTVTLGFLALTLSAGGCTLVHDAASLAVYRTNEALRDCEECVRNKKWANQAWDRVRGHKARAAYSHDYAHGFKDGYAHYLFRGGNGEPPPLPPRRYRMIHYQTPQGYRAIEDWFAGFRHGAAVAQESGHRRYVTGPSSLGGVEAGEAIPVVETGLPGPALPPTEGVVPTAPVSPAVSSEQLPIPRSVPSAEPMPDAVIEIKPKPLIPMYGPRPGSQPRSPDLP